MNILSPPLFKCTVCTLYNIYVVTVFTYRYDTPLESVRWQEEEVSWGGFVPYDEIVRSVREDVNCRLLGGEGTERDEKN